MTTHTVTEADAIELVLHSDSVVPPGREGSGAALDLRAAMARFAPPAVHRPRRRAVEEVVAAIDVDEARELARRATLEQLPVTADAIELARSVPVRTLLAALGLVPIDDETSGASVTADVDEVAAVIGRGADASAAADAAATRLLAVAGSRGRDPVAVASVLYQCLDAVAGLIATTLHARALDTDRVPAVPRTVRVATETFEIGEMPVAVGDVFQLEIGGAGLEFGAGPHACPGRELAEAIASAVVAAIEESHTIDLAMVTVDSDGRPETLPLSAGPLANT